MFCLKNEETLLRFYKLLTEYDALFNGEIGCLKDFKVNIPIDKEAKPKFCWTRPVPYALKGVEKELDHLETQGIYKRVPIVPLVKSDNGGI